MLTHLRYLLVSFLDPLVTEEYAVHVYRSVNFPNFLLLLISDFIPLHLENMLRMISVLLCLQRIVL